MPTEPETFDINEISTEDMITEEFEIEDIGEGLVIDGFPVEDLVTKEFDSEDIDIETFETNEFSSNSLMIEKVNMEAIECENRDIPSEELIIEELAVEDSSIASVPEPEENLHARKNIATAAQVERILLKQLIRHIFTCLNYLLITIFRLSVISVILRLCAKMVKKFTTKSIIVTS